MRVLATNRALDPVKFVDSAGCRLPVASSRLLFVHMCDVPAALTGLREATDG